MQTDQDRAIIDLTNAWNSLCPEQDRGFVTKLLREMIANGTKDKVGQCRVIVGRLYDGLILGDWPST